jgi:hypothetical protein
VGGGRGGAARVMVKVACGPASSAPQHASDIFLL